MFTVWFWVGHVPLQISPIIRQAICLSLYILRVLVASSTYIHLYNKGDRHWPGHWVRAAMTDKEAGFPRRIPFIRNPYDPTVVLILSVDWLPLVESTHVMVTILLIFSLLTLSKVLLMIRSLFWTPTFQSNLTISLLRTVRLYSLITKHGYWFFFFNFF